VTFKASSARINTVLNGVILYIKQRFGSGISTSIRDTLAKEVFAIQFDYIVLPSTHSTMFKDERGE